jgi:arsenite methyltransferase
MAKGKQILGALLGVPMPDEGGEISIKGSTFTMHGDILRQKSLVRGVQEDLADFYGKHWKMPGAYDSEASDEFLRDLFRAMFPGFEKKVPKQVGVAAVVLDAGCGSGAAGRAYFKGLFDRLTYVGVDMSSAVEQAQADFASRDMDVALMQAEINNLPFKGGTFDLIFCPGVLHYATDMQEAIRNLAAFLRRGGRFVTWVYKKQKPLRQLTDAYLRSVLSRMPAEEAFEAVKPLTKLGIALGKLKQEIEIPEDIPILEIKAGKYDLQRFFYYNIMKLFYNASLPFTRHVVNNWNAYYPKHVLFLSPEEIKSFFPKAGLRIEECAEEGNGLSVIAVKE